MDRKLEKRESTGYKVFRVCVYILLCVLVFLSLFPFVILFVNATRSTPEIQQGVAVIPSKYFMANLEILLDKGFNVFRGFLNSSGIAVSATLLSVYFASLTAYGFTAYEFKGKKVLFTIIIFLILIPSQLSLMGFFKLVLNMGLYDTYIPLIIPAIAAPSTVFFMRQYLAGIYQQELIDSARIDGAGEIRIFHTIMLPIMKPAIATMSIFTFVATWNNFLTPLVIISTQDKYTLPMLVKLLTSDMYKTEYGVIYLGVSLSILPLIIVYLLLSKYIVKGITLGGVKE